MILLILNSIAFILSIYIVIITWQIYKCLPYKPLIWLIVGFCTLVLVRASILVSMCFNINAFFVDCTLSLGAFTIGMLLLGMLYLKRAITNYISERKRK